MLNPPGHHAIPLLIAENGHIQEGVACGTRTLPVLGAEELQRLGRHIEQARAHCGVRVLSAVMAEAHTAAALHAKHYCAVAVSLDITARTEYGSEVGSDFMHEPGGRTD